jgi:hypothetical protein
MSWDALDRLLYGDEPKPKKKPVTNLAQQVSVGTNKTWVGPYPSGIVIMARGLTCSAA